MVYKALMKYTSENEKNSRTPYPKQRVPEWSERLQNVRNYAEDEPDIETPFYKWASTAWIVDVFSRSCTWAFC